MWYFKNVWLKWRYRHLPFKMKNWTETQKSDCIADIINDISKISIKYDHDITRWNLKWKKDEVLNCYTNIFGDRKELKKPIFTQNEIASISSNTIWEIFLITLFIILEGFIFSQLMNLIIPREVRRQFWWISIPIGVALSLLIVKTVKTSFTYYYDYIEARALKLEENYPDFKMDKFIKNRNISYFIFVAFIAFSIFAGFIREKVLLGDAAETNPFMGKMVFFMSLTLSLMVVVVLALIEKQLHDKKIKNAVFKNWRKHEKERKEYMTSLKEMYTKATRSIAVNMEYYWSLVLDLQRIFGLQFDDEDKVIYEIFRSRVTSKEINLNQITDEIYYIYTPIQCADEHLFKYGIERDERIVKDIEKLKIIKDEIEKFEKTYKPE